jgi:hypothetical protein
MRRRLALASITLALVAGGGVAVGAAVAGSKPSPVTRVSTYAASGPSAQYDFDAGSIKEGVPISVAVPPGAHDAVVTVSFEYRTKGVGPFTASVYAPFDAPTFTARPSEVRLAPAAAPGTVTTARFGIRGLSGGRTYQFVFGVNSVFDDGVNNIFTRRVVTTVDLTRR